MKASSGPRRSFGAVGLCLCCVVSGNGYGLFLVRAGLFKAKSNIGKLKETRAGGDAAATVFPNAFANRSFQAMARSNPQPVGAIGCFGEFGFLCHREVKGFICWASRFGPGLFSV